MAMPWERDPVVSAAPWEEDEVVEPSAQTVQERPPLGIDPTEGTDEDRAHWATQLKPTFTAAGSIGGSVVGAAAGAPAGPVGSIAGFAAGGALGAAGGAAAHENFLDVLRAFGAQGLPPPPELGERVRDSAEEALFDFTFTTAFGGIPALGQMIRGGRKSVAQFFGRGTDVVKSAEDVIDPVSLRTLHKILGVTEDGVRMGQKAETLGVELGAAQVTEGTVPGLFTKVLARFPLIGGPARARFLRAQGQTLEAGERLMMRIGPSMNMADLGIDLNKAADRRFTVFRDEINELYDGARQLARETNATIPTASLQRKARLYLRQLQRIRGADYVEDASDPTIRFLRTVEDLDANIPFDRFDGLAMQLDEAMAKAKTDGLNLSALAAWKKEVMEPALKNISNPQVAEMIAEADGKFTKTMTEIFETSTAQRFNRIEKNRFGIGFSRQGTANMDEAFNIVFKQQNKSPQAMRDLRALVDNDEIFNAAVRYHMDDVFTSGVKRSADGTMTFDIHGIRRQLGINNKRSGEYGAINEALRGTGTNMRQIENLLDVMEATLRNAPDNVNAFIARRATLGGRQALLSTLTAGAVGTAGGSAAQGVSLIGAMSFLVGARKFGKIISDPATLRSATIAMDPMQSLSKRMGAFRVLVRLSADDPAAEWTEMLNEAMGTPEEDNLAEPVRLAR